MKKALLAALCFILVSLVMVNGTFALPDLDDVFADLTELLGDVFGKPQAGGAGTGVDVDLISDTQMKNLYPGGSVSRTFHVENVGTKDVYFRLVFAIQYEEESWDHLTIYFDADTGFTGPDWRDIKIDGTPYKMAVFTYTGALAAGDVPPAVGISIAMDSTVTSQQIARYRSDFLQVQVLAIETEVFSGVDGINSATDALDRALPLSSLNPF